jgi:NADPH-dependent glutamate synthase beta subunit-like oxidoreductase
VAEEIAAIMGMAIEAKEPDIARPGCTYGVQDADTKYVYDGLTDCRAVALLGGGMKVCTIGCLGLGTCARVCPFDAITMGPDNLPVVDEEKCTGCGTCERVCPKHIINLSSVTRRILKEYTVDECTTPCQRACPAGINICEYIRQIALGDYYRAVQVIKERNPFPTVIGRICPRPCENDCRRQYVDEPVAINFLKRYAADYEKDSGRRVQPYKAPATGKKVAVVGGGVEGLSTAFFLARLGHEPTVFEATPKLGGLLRSAIAKNRLPEEILDWDIEGVIQMGVKAETHRALGKNITLDSLLRQDYDAVFVALGGWDSRLARGGVTEIESPLPGALLMVDVVKAARRGDELPAFAEDVVIVGGGRLALETADICAANGARNIRLLLRELQVDAALSAEDQAHLEQKGVTVHVATAVGRLFGRGSQLKEVELIDLAGGDKERVKAGSLILAVGRFPEMIFQKLEPETEEAAMEAQPDEALAWKAVEPSKPPALRDEKGLFAEGDVLTDYSAAIKAIGAGRRAAASVHECMYGITLDHPDNVLTPESNIQNIEHARGVATHSRQVMPLSKPSELSRNAELEKGYTEEMARDEANRCLQCGLICYRHNGN